MRLLKDICALLAAVVLLMAASPRASYGDTMSGPGWGAQLMGCDPRAVASGGHGPFGSPPPPAPPSPCASKPRLDESAFLGMTGEMYDLGLGTESIAVNFSQGVTLDSFRLEDFYMQTGWLSAWENGRVRVFDIGGHLLTTVSLRARTPLGVRTITHPGVQGASALELFPDHVILSRNLAKVANSFEMMAAHTGEHSPVGTVSEPGTVFLMGAGLGLAAWWRKRRTETGNKNTY